MWDCHPEFVPLLRRFTVDALREHAGTVFGLWPDLTLACTNPAWHKFANDNGGELRDWLLGTSIVSTFGPLTEFYTTALERCLRTQTEWEHLYECSSPQLFRKFLMKVYPLGNSEGLLVVNSLVVECLHDVASRNFGEEVYRDATGFAHMCAHCRRFQRQDESDAWDWIPVYVSNLPEDVSHGLCPVCFRYHFPAEVELAESKGMRI